tara:strand:+ start:11730 stop:12293 length:564 start_codon:yes stop_codon:yes gene_type:complete
MITKQALRKHYRALRASLDEATIADQSLAIANQALKLPIWGHTNYHIFLPIENKAEVDTSYLLHVLQGKDKSIILSKSNFKTTIMQHILLQENTHISVSKFGIPEPQEGIEVTASSIDVVFVPLLAFDKKGHRIGYGKGFYDRFLKGCKPNTRFVGVSFFEAEQTVAHTAHDIPLHFCITPKKVYSF